MYELNAVFIFGNCEKKILWKYKHALCIYHHNFHYQNVQHTIVLLFAMVKVSLI